MSKKLINQEQLLRENSDLRHRLETAEQTLNDILCNEADALLVPGSAGKQLFTLKGADQMYRTLIENLGEGALALTSEGLILYSNRSFAGMLGTSLEKIIGSDIQKLFTPDSWQGLKAVLKNDKIEKYREELLLSSADGKLIPVYLSVSRLKVDGIPDSFCVIATDLTEQKRNTALLADGKFTREILEQASDVIVICDGTGRIIHTSKKAQAFCSRNLHGQLFEHTFPLRRLDGTPLCSINSINEDLRQLEEMSLQYEGQKFNFLVSIGHLKGVKDELLGCIITMTDITERKAQEIALQTSEKQLSEALTIAKIGYWEFDTASEEFIFNDQYYQLHKITAKEAGGYKMSLADFVRHYIHSDDADMVLENIRKILGSSTQNNSVMTETRMLTGKGEIIWVEVRLRIQKDAQNNTIHIFGINQDITGRKEKEARIIYLNRLYAVLSGINSLIVHAKDRTELFREACQIAVKGGGFHTAIISTVDPRTKKIVHEFSASENMDFLAKIKNLRLSDDDASKTMIARAISENKVVISNDSVNDPLVVSSSEYGKYGIHSMVVLPLFVNSGSIDAIALYAREINFFQKDEINLLTELADDIMFAMHYIGNQARLEYLTFYDELTGLSNRRLFLVQVEQHIHNAVTDSHKLAIFQIDLERFKNINDSLGRKAGDELLKQVAEWLRLNMGDSTLLARITNDLFALVMPISQNDDLTRFIEKKMEAFSQHQFRMADAEFRINAKVGIALFPDDGSEAEILLRNAEAACKKAKSRGERYLFHTQKMTELVAQKLTLENQLRLAIDNEEFVLFYQPKLDLASRKTTGAEALIRWNKPNAGLIPPFEFIPILEETGLIHEVGRWAMQKAISDYLHWRNMGLASVRIAVNVSALQLRNPAFIDEIKQVTAIDPHSASGLELEITESLIMEDVNRHINTLQEIRDMGITIAIDDFGTGFSSLSYLARLPVDTLKIDRSFINDITVGPDGLALVSTIINLAHSMDLKVVAEGVETEEQSHLLHLLRCEEIQGFLFSEAVPEEIFRTKFLVPADNA